MVAEELAVRLASTHVSENCRVIDPFCGSGRLLAACGGASLRVGLDINPLACLLTRAKLSRPRRAVLMRVFSDLDAARKARRKHVRPIEYDRLVPWFSPEALAELGKIVHWINSLQLEERELCVVAACLSAVVRESSFARQGGWKLHRISEDDRIKFAVDPWGRLARRLEYCIDEIGMQPALRNRSYVRCADARFATFNNETKFDLMLTSPPYGDSRTTVQYGAASALCLSIISRLEGLTELSRTGGQIDGACLGGIGASAATRGDIKRYWAGSQHNNRAIDVLRFLNDYEAVSRNISSRIRNGGTAIFVVGRRSVGGFRLKLDDFTVDMMGKEGFDLMSKEVRQLKQKRFPTRVNRFARSSQHQNSGQVPTMSSEIIVVLRKVRTANRTGAH